MAKGTTKTNFKTEFTARVKKARQLAGYTQQQMADFLDIDQGTYKQYEGRSYMPHDLVPRFALLCRVDAGWLFTGNVRSTGPAEAERKNRRAAPKARSYKAA